MKSQRKRSTSVGLALTAIAFWPLAVANAQEIWTVTGGDAEVAFDAGALARLNLTFSEGDLAQSLANDRSFVRRRYLVDQNTDLTFSVTDANLDILQGDAIRLIGSLSITSGGRNAILEAPLIDLPAGQSFEQLQITGLLAGEDAGLILDRIKFGFDHAGRTLTIHSGHVRLAPQWAEALGDPSLADQVLGTVTLTATAEWIGGTRPAALEPQPIPQASVGADMTFCQLYGLSQWGREGDIVGLSEGTTSWNVGDADMEWFPVPNENHPFIVMNLYRNKDDRFEQIGMSCIKHGFYALANTQCGGICTHESGHSQGDWLGVGCTDTYSVALNASQIGFGPRYEVDPWTGNWNYPTSHLAQGIHSHDEIEHRLQVYDQDLNPAQNPGATYYAEGLYVCNDDVNVMNSASWKQVWVSGTPGGMWSFVMSAADVQPNIGFAVDAWTSADQVMIAQEVPPVEFVSPDGRCILSAKAKPVGGNYWRYEYALLNIDMDRQVGSFSVPLPGGVQVTTTGFHAVYRHDEELNAPDGVPIDNAPWEPEVTTANVRWSTATNPIMWNTLYNFWFDVNAAPGTVTVNLGLFRPGTPSILHGDITGPSGPADCQSNGIPDNLDLAAGTSQDCNADLVPDECEVPPLGNGQDCNDNTVPDECELDDNDCDVNGVPDDCEPDCNANGAADACDILGGTSDDCDTNGVPDDCQPDCDGDGTPDACDIGAVVFEDDFEIDRGWTVESDPSLTQGEWERADPQQFLYAGHVTQPEDDHTPAPGSLCYVTKASGPFTFQSDVANGPTSLISPAIDPDSEIVTLIYSYWFFTTAGTPDRLTVEVSDDDGVTWFPLAEHTGNSTAWSTHSVLVSEVITPTDAMRFRFSTADQPDDSYTEALIDDVYVTVPECGPQTADGDFDHDGDVDLFDFSAFQQCRGAAATGACGNAFEMVPDGIIDLQDYAALEGHISGP